MFAIEPQLPDGIREAARLAGCKIEWLPPKFHNGARIYGSGGYQIVNDFGVCMVHVKVDATFDEWLIVIGQVLDFVREGGEDIQDILKGRRGR